MIFLTSSVASVAEHLYKNFLAENHYHSVLFIDTAAEPEIEDGDDDTWLQNDLKSLQNVGYQVDRYSVTGKTREDVAKKFNDYDILYMCGGNTAHLLGQLQQTGSLSLIKEQVSNGKPYIGTSAGSIVAGPEIPIYLREEAPKLEDYTCLNFVNFIVVPHWGSEHFRDEYVGKRIETAYRTDLPPFLLISDTQYVRIEGERLFEVIET